MPDHVHILLQVVYRSGKHLDFYIDCLCDKIAERYSSIKGRVIKAEEIFVPGYCDKPLYDNRNLDTLFRYIRENPHRLAMRKQYPQFFRRVRQLQIGEGEYETYGNLFLLRNPDKEQVVVHRADAKMPEKLARLREEWLYSAANGGVLVSPFISEHERDIRKEAEALGARIILITHEAFPERYKPSAHEFALCEEGRLLIISTGGTSNAGLSRDACLAMNGLASEICNKF